MLRGGRPRSKGREPSLDAAACSLCKPIERPCEAHCQQQMVCLLRRAGAVNSGLKNDLHNLGFDEGAVAMKPGPTSVPNDIREERVFVGQAGILRTAPIDEHPDACCSRSACACTILPGTECSGPCNTHQRVIYGVLVLLPMLSKWLHGAMGWPLHRMAMPMGGGGASRAATPQAAGVALRADARVQLLHLLPRTQSRPRGSHAARPRRGPAAGAAAEAPKGAARPADVSALSTRANAGPRQLCGSVRRPCWFARGPLAPLLDEFCSH